MHPRRQSPSFKLIGNANVLRRPLRLHDSKIHFGLCFCFCDHRGSSVPICRQSRFRHIKGIIETDHARYKRRTSKDRRENIWSGAENFENTRTIHKIRNRIAIIIKLCKALRSGRIREKIQRASEEVYGESDGHDSEDESGVRSDKSEDELAIGHMCVWKFCIYYNTILYFNQMPLQPGVRASKAFFA